MTGGDVRFGRGELLAFSALVVLPVAAMWLAGSWFPSQDGPIHLEIARLLRDLVTDPEGPAAGWFQLDRRPEPNWAIYLPLAALGGGLPPAAAEKVLVTVYAVALPLALLYALRGVRREAGYLALLGLPLVWNHPLHMGFYNFAWSLPAGLVAAGFYARRRGRLSWRLAIGLALLLAITALCHPIGLLAGCLLLAALVAGGRGGQDGAGSGEPATARATAPGLAEVLRLAAAALPSLTLVALFVGGGVGRAVERLPFEALVKHLLLGFALVSYHRVEAVFSVLFVLALATASLGVLVIRWRKWRRDGRVGGREPGPEASDGGEARIQGRRAPGITIERAVRESCGAARHWRPDDPLLAAATLVLAAYLLAPVGLLGGGYLNQRLQLVLFLTVLLWLAAVPVVDRWRRPLAAAGAVSALGLALLHAGTYRAYAAPLADFQTAAAHLEAGDTLLAVSRDDRGHSPAGRPLSFKVAPFEHGAARLAAETGALDLGNYQAGQGYFPVHYRPPCDPFDPEDGLWRERRPGAAARIRLAAYLERPDCPVDWLVLWGKASADEDSILERWLSEEHGYRPGHRSADGRLALYRRSEP